MSTPKRKLVSKPSMPWKIEWATIMLVVACTVTWTIGIWLVGRQEVLLALPLLALIVALHSSLQHEIIHGHPTKLGWLNDLMVFPAIGLFLPFHRFRDLHLLHHNDCELSNPATDPESPYLSAGDWARMSLVRRRLWLFNNTLIGRLTVGPLITIVTLIRDDARRLMGGDLRVAGHWGAHGLALSPVLAWLWFCGVPIWLYAFLAAWPGMSILMLRTFAEHRWHPEVAGRSVMMRRGGPFALLFLNNHLHAAHHFRPDLAWHRLPALARRLESNGLIQGERFESYLDVTRQYLFRTRRPIVWKDRESDA